MARIWTRLALKKEGADRAPPPLAADHSFVSDSRKLFDQNVGANIASRTAGKEVSGQRRALGYRWSSVMALLWGSFSATIISFLTTFIAGIAIGYAIRAHISVRRRTAAQRRYDVTGSYRRLA